MTPVEHLFRLPNVEGTTAIILEPVDPDADDATVRIGVSDRGFSTPPGSPGGALDFRSVFAQRGALDLRESLTQPGQTTGDAQYTSGRVVLDANSSMQSNWPRYRFAGRPATIYLGGVLRTDGSPMPLEEFDVVLDGEIEQVRPIGQNQWELTFADLRQRFDVNASPSVYRGFGGAFRIDGTPGADTYLTGPGSAELQRSCALSTVFVGVVRQVRDSGRPTPLLMLGENDPDLAVNWGLFLLDSSNPPRLGFAGGIDTSGGPTDGLSTMIDSNHDVPIGVPVFLAGTVDEDCQTVRFWYAADGGRVEQVFVGALPYPIGMPATAHTQIGQPGGSSFDAWEEQAWKIALGRDQLQRLNDAAIVGANLNAEVAEAWKFSEGAKLGLGPAYVFGEKGVEPLTPAGAASNPEWVASEDGDDPGEFPGSAAGLSRARAYGPFFNIRPRRVDFQRGVYSWDEGPTDSVSVVRQRGVPIVREHAVSSAGGGDLAVTGPRTIVSSVSGAFSAFIPGQANPSRLGQRVALRSWGIASNNGVARVEVDGISSDGTVLRISDRNLLAEIAPPGAVVESYGPDVEYSLRTDDGASIITLTEPQPAELTLDGFGRLPASGTARWTEMTEMLVGSVPVTSGVSFDPVLGWYLEPGQDMTLNDVLSQMARSAFGWWVRDPGGEFRLGNFGPPTATSVTVDARQIRTVTPVRSPDPFARYEVRWRKNWTVQDGDALAGSVSEADRQRFSNPYTVESVTSWSTRSAYPNAVDHPGFDTWLSEIGDVATFKSLATPMLTERRNWYTVEFKSFWPWFIKLNDVIQLTWDDPNLGLASTPCRVTSRRLNFGSYTISLEVHD